MPLCVSSEQCPGRVEFIRMMIGFILTQQQSEQEIQDCPVTRQNFILAKLEIFRNLWNECTCCICPQHHNCKTCFTDFLALHMSLLLKRAMNYNQTSVEILRLQQEYHRLYIHYNNYRVLNNAHP